MACKRSGVRVPVSPPHRTVSMSNIPHTHENGGNGGGIDALNNHAASILVSGLVALGGTGLGASHHRVVHFPATPKPTPDKICTPNPNFTVGIQDDSLI